MVAILSISGMQFGYGIIEITTIYNQTQLLQTYNISSLPFGLGVGLLVGLMPIGAVFGNLIGKCIVSRLSLKYLSIDCRNAHHLVNLLCMVSSFALMQITLEGTIFAGRFLYGFCIACYCAWSPRYIQDIAPVNLKVFVRSVYSIWVVGAMMLGYFFGVIFYHNSVNNYYRIMFCFPGIMAAIQLLLMWLFVPNSPA
jgi:MFS family permease